MQPKFLNMSKSNAPTAATKTPFAIINHPATKVSVIGIICIFLAVVTGAAAVPLQVHLPLQSSFLKLSWRQLSMIPYLWVAGAVQMYFEKDFSIKRLFKKDLLKKFIVMGVIGDCMSLCHLLAGTYSIMTHAFVFQNLGGSLIVLYSLLRGIEVHKLELIGTAVSLLGCLITVTDKGAQKVNPE